jgi:hypothetical protein
MAAIYVYGLISLPESDFVLPTGMKSGLEIVACEDVAAVVERWIVLEAIQQNEEDLLEAVLCHDRVIGELFAQTAVLPLRFGSSFVSLEAIRLHLQVRRDEYSLRLSFLRSKGEFLLKMVPVEAKPASISTQTRGKEYFLAKKQRYQSSQVFLEEQAKQLEALLRLIAGFYPQMVRSPAQGKLERIYLLVKLNEELLLKQRVPEWQQQCNYWELHLGEAMPAYHFAAGFSDLGKA